jgi:hypothetical protein
MAQLNNVRPGDLIRAEDWNALVAAVEGFSVPVTGGPISVPSLFGLTLGNAVAILTLPATQLVVGTLFDTLGNTVDSTLNDSKPLLVLNQVPAAGTKVFAGSAVNLVVSPKPGSAPPPPKVPIIGGFKQAQVAIGAQAEIDGQNFEPGKTSVTFDGVFAAAPGFPPSSPSQLFVVVPTGIPGAPSSAGQTKDVQVIVTTSSGGPSSPATLTILPPLTNPLPTITDFDQKPGTVGAVVTVTGSGFDTSAAANNSFSFGGVVQPAQSVISATQVTVTIPTGIPGVTSAGATINVTVTVGGQTSPTIGYFITT